MPGFVKHIICFVVVPVFVCELDFDVVRVCVFVGLVVFFFRFVFVCVSFIILSCFSIGSC